MSGGVSGVYVRDCVLSNTRYGIELKANKVRGGYIKDLHVSDSQVDRILIHSVTYNADGDPADTCPVFSDMSFKNLTILGYSNEKSDPWLSTAIELEGFGQDSYISNVSFEDITVGTENNVTQNISMKYCRDIAFDNVLQSDGAIPLYSDTDAEFTVNGGALSELVPEFTQAIEAERMNLDGYAYESNDYASAGGCASANSSGKGTAKAKFVGESGVYDLTVTYFDENDGKAGFKLYVNDEQADEWTADAELGSDSADAATLTSRVIRLELSKGDIISIEGTKERYDPARLDKLELTRVDTPQETFVPITSADGFADMLRIEKRVDENGSAVLTVIPTEDTVLPRLTLYAAVYSADGTLCGLDSIQCAAEEGSATVTVPEPQTDNGGYYNIMLWTDAQAPVINVDSGIY